MLTTLAWISLTIAFGCAALIALDEVRHPLKMWIMNVVWPVTALYLGVFAVGILATWPRHGPLRKDQLKESWR